MVIFNSYVKLPDGIYDYTCKLENMMLVLTDLFAHSSMHLLMYSFIHFMSFHVISCHINSYQFISFHSFIHSYLLDWFMCFLVLCIQNYYIYIHILYYTHIYIYIYIYYIIHIYIYIRAHIVCLNRKAGTHHLCAPMAACSPELSHSH